MLGEAARNADQAEAYYSSYKNAIDEVGKINLIKTRSNGVSIKISALYPRYEMLKLSEIELLFFLLTSFASFFNQVVLKLLAS